MSNDISFQLDTAAAEDILTKLALPIVNQSGQAIAARAQAMANSISTKPPQVSITTIVGTIRRGRRAIATVSAAGIDAHSNYVGRIALVKARDAGRV